MSLKRSGITIIISMLMVVGITVTGFTANKVINFQHMNTIPSSQKVIDEAIEKFEESHPGVEIKETLVGWGEAHSNFMNSLVVGMAPDLVMLGGPWAPEFRRMGAFAPVDKYLPEKLMDKFLPTALSAVKADGHVYGVPWEGATWSFFYRKDLFKEAGLGPNDPPENWEELVEYAKKLTKDGQHGLVFPAAGWEAADYYLPFMWQAGNNIVKEDDGKFVANFDNDKALKATQFYYNLINKHKVVPKSITSMDWEAAKNAFVVGDAAMMINGMWVVNTIKEGSPELDGKWATAVNPAGPAGKAALGYPNTLHITTQSKNKGLAAKFIEFYYGGESPTYADRYAMAVGSLNWTKPFMDLPYTEDELIAPFVESMNFGHYPPTAPKYEDFKSLYFNPGLQSLILGETKPEEFVKDMQKKFNKLSN